jgi:hypothetical protein
MTRLNGSLVPIRSSGSTGSIKRQVRSGNYEFSGHAEDERQAERIPIADVEAALLNGEMLEDYQTIRVVRVV